jgi:hypothetical protein
LLVDAQIAQLVEQRIENPRVLGSIPSLGTIIRIDKGRPHTLAFVLSGFCILRRSSAFASFQFFSNTLSNTKLMLLGTCYYGAPNFTHKLHTATQR